MADFPQGLASCDASPLRKGPQRAFLRPAPVTQPAMVKPQFPTLLRLAPALVLWSCAIPKAIIVKSPNTAKTDPSAPPAELSNANLPALPDDGIRLPDMLAMPGDSEFHATSPNIPKGGPDASAVIARPPTDPPVRPKPKDKQLGPE